MTPRCPLRLGWAPLVPGLFLESLATGATGGHWVIESETQIMLARKGMKGLFNLLNLQTKEMLHS